MAVGDPFVEVRTFSFGLGALGGVKRRLRKNHAVDGLQLSQAGTGGVAASTSATVEGAGSTETVARLQLAGDDERGRCNASVKLGVDHAPRRAPGSLLGWRG